MIISYVGIVLGYVNKGLLFILILSPEQIGLVNLLYNVGALFAQFANLGSIYTTWKFFPYFRNKEKQHFGFFPLMILLVLIGILICFTLAIVFKENIQVLYLEKSPAFVQYYFWFIPIGIATVFFIFFDVYLRSLFKNVASVFAIEVLLRLALTVVLIAYWNQWIDFYWFVILHSFTYFVPSIILVFYLIKIKEFNLHFKSISIPRRFKKIILRFSAYFYINTLGLVLVNSLDVIMLAQMSGLKSTGIFTTIVFLIGAIQVPYKSIVRSSSSLVSEYWKHRRFKDMAELYTKVSSVALTIALILFLFLGMNIHFLFSFLKPEFYAGISVFFILMVGRIFDMYCGLNSSIFTTSKFYKYDVFFTVGLIAMIYFLNRWLIPMYDMNGAALSTSIAMVITNIGRLVFVYFVFKMHPFTWKQIIVIVNAALTMFLGYVLSQFFDQGWLLFFAQCLLIFFSFLLPIYFFKLDPDVVNYFNNGSRFILKKIGKQ